jgi:hypothetical protein
VDGIKARLDKVEYGDSDLGSKDPQHSLNAASKLIQTLKFSEITSRASTASKAIQLDQMQLNLRIIRVEKFVVLSVKAKAEYVPQLRQVTSILEMLGWRVTPLKSNEVVFVRLLTEPSDLVLASQLHVLLSELV